MELQGFILIWLQTEFHGICSCVGPIPQSHGARGLVPSQPLALSYPMEQLNVPTNNLELNRGSTSKKLERYFQIH